MGKDATLPQAYCPISLPNTDYKILASILVARLNLVMGDYIHPDQSGFVKQRYLGDNVRRRMNVIDQARFKKECGIILHGLRESVQLGLLDVYAMSIREAGI